MFLRYCTMLCSFAIEGGCCQSSACRAATGSVYLREVCPRGRAHTRAHWNCSGARGPVKVGSEFARQLPLAESRGLHLPGSGGAIRSAVYACIAQVPAHPYRVRIRRPVDCLGGAADLPAQWPVSVGAVPPNVARLPIAGWHWATHHLSPGLPNTARGYPA
jgi:hypothetical protein